LALSPLPPSPPPPLCRKNAGKMGEEKRGKTHSWSLHIHLLAFLGPRNSWKKGTKTIYIFNDFLSKRIRKKQQLNKGKDR
jgi:hypothetical protein